MIIPKSQEEYLKKKEEEMKKVKEWRKIKVAEFPHLREQITEEGYTRTIALNEK